MAGSSGARGPSFDADAWLAALERPQVRIDNVTYRGRILSIEEWLPFESLLEQVIAAEGTAIPELLAFAEQYLRAVFPREDLPWLLRLAGRDPVPRLLALPWAALVELLKNFVVAQRRAMGLLTTPSTPPGPNSSD